MLKKVKLPKEGLDKQVELCARLCKEAHDGQKRWNDQPYYTHPYRIADTFRIDIKDHKHSFYVYPLEFTQYYNFIAKCTSYLHDVLEDCEGWTDEKLIAEGVLPEIVWPVRILTKLPGEKYLNYILRVKEANNLPALMVKYNDIEDNLRDLHEYPNMTHKIDRYEMALHILEN